MTKPKPTPGQLSLFDTSQYERVRSRYDIEDGYEEEEPDYWPPKPVSESNWPPVSESNLETDPNFDSLTNDSLTKAEPCGTIGKYRAGGSARGGGEYWRYSYKFGGKTHHVHIPGGCCSNTIASDRADEIRCAIASGTSTVYVLDLIRSWTRKNQ